MPMELNLTRKNTISWKFENVEDVSRTVDAKAYEHELSFTSGQGENEADEMYRTRVLLSPGSPVQDIDLSGLVENVFGRSVRFATIKGIEIVNLGEPPATEGDLHAPVSGEDVLVGGAGALANAWGALFNGSQTSLVRVKSGGSFGMTAPLDGFAVSPSAGDVLRLELDGGGVETIEVDVILWGVRES